MRIIKSAFIHDAIRRHSDAGPGLLAWSQIVKGASWDKFNDVRASINTADRVVTASGRAVVVFNIGGNRYRLICAIHYDHRRIYLLRFLTHAEYSKNFWKADL